jgi:hypothetical protein
MRLPAAGLPAAKQGQGGVEPELAPRNKPRPIEQGSKPTLRSRKNRSHKKQKVAFIVALLAVAAIGGVLAWFFGVGSSSPSEATVVFSLAAEGDVSDYDEDVIDGLKAAFAEQADVEPSQVEVAVSAASVMIEVTITAASVQAAAYIADELDGVFSSADAATEFLATAHLGGYVVTVTQIVSAPTVYSELSTGDNDGNSENDQNHDNDDSVTCDALCDACRADSSCVVRAHAHLPHARSCVQPMQRTCLSCAERAQTSTLSASASPHLRPCRGSWRWR